MKADLRTARERPAPPPGVVFAAAVLWFGFWYLTPGLVSYGAGSIITEDPVVSVLIETILALVLSVILLLTHRRYNRVLFARTWSLWLYAMPLVLAIALPFHYGLVLPVALYMFWQAVSVFWQDYLTFGLLQSYLGERLPRWGVLIVSAVIFWLGHVIFLPDKFAPTNVIPSMVILVLGFALASLRIWLGSLHLILALHLAFYFVLA